MKYLYTNHKEVIILQKSAYVPFFHVGRLERYNSYQQKNPNLSWLDVITHVNIGLDQAHYSNVQLIDNPSELTVLVNKYRQLSDGYEPKDLETIDQRFNPDGLKLRHYARVAFEKMCEDALAEGISLKAVSAYRSFSYQQEVYNRYKTQDKTEEEYQAIRDKVSARAGHSEHQTGLAVDINDLEESFADTPEAKWLADNAYKYGFILRYPKGKELITGYNYEPWHFRYLGRKLAADVSKSGLTYDEYYARFLLSR